MAKPLAERFWAKVQKTETCWLWTGALMSKGYGSIQYGDRRNHPVLATRVSWELAHGPIPDGRWVLHHCDVPRCVRPDHLYLGTVSENSRDMWSRGRAILPTRQPVAAERARGSHHPIAKVTEDQVADMRRRYAAGGISQQKLANEYGLNQSHVSDILRRVIWQHVS